MNTQPISKKTEVEPFQRTQIPVSILILVLPLVSILILVLAYVSVTLFSISPAKSLLAKTKQDMLPYTLNSTTWLQNVYGPDNKKISNAKHRCPPWIAGGNCCKASKGAQIDYLGEVSKQETSKMSGEVMMKISRNNPLVPGACPFQNLYVVYSPEQIFHIIETDIKDRERKDRIETLITTSQDN
ncbi:hypothetical protein [Shewanella colwelliana]|uniref:hypothetical protein n=1 Tax=Shewanella colwelliana TaxID=23 RepID=UPI0022AF321D|nr:hypothetical protein [Shewanella colwelliana]MCZ4337631.1 hypothetical protein [Shewanella colwelliana]